MSLFEMNVLQDNLTLRKISDLSETSKFVLVETNEITETSLVKILPTIGAVESSISQVGFVKSRVGTSASAYILTKGHRPPFEEINVADRNGTWPSIKISLHVFYSHLIATVLEDAIIALHITKECNTDVRLRQIMNDMPKLLTDKYGVNDIVDSRKVIQMCDSAHKLTKIVDDRNKILETLEATYAELGRNNSWQPIGERVAADIRAKNDAFNLMEEECSNMQKLRELIKQNLHLRNYQKTKEYELNLIKTNLQTKLEDAGMLAEVEIRYTDNWSTSQHEQYKLSINLAEKRSSDSIKKHKRLQDIEHRVHNEIESLYNSLIIETLEKADYWMEKYDNDMEQIDLKIQLMRNDYLAALQKTKELKKQIHLREIELDDWKAFTGERAGKEKYIEDMHRNAKIIQAWWRGILCRQKLGPYQDKTKKTKKTKAKK